MTTRRLRSVMDPKGVLVAIDPFPKQRLGFSAYRIVAHREVSSITRGSVKWMRTTGAQAASELKANYFRSFDFLFIDGDHSWEGIKGDWEGWRDLIAPGGIVADMTAVSLRFDSSMGQGAFYMSSRLFRKTRASRV